MNQTIRILIADDDHDDAELMREAFEESGIPNLIDHVTDGVRLLDYLYQRGAYADKEKYPRPGIILLDLNMPKCDGRSALTTIKRDADLRSIPVVVMTTSCDDEDIFRSYDLGASGYVTKPVTFEALKACIAQFGNYWLETVELPKSS